MITVANYNTAVKNIDFKSAPEAIQAMHNKFDSMSKYYDKNEGITDAINVYMEKLNKWYAGSRIAEKVVKNPSIKTKAKKAATKPIAKKTATSVKVKKVAMPQKLKKVKVKAKVKIINVKVPKAPVMRKVNSLELTICKSYLAMDGQSRKPMVFIMLFHKIEKAFKLNNIHDHKSVIMEMRDNLKNIIDDIKEKSITSSIPVKMNTAFRDKIAAIVSSASERVRTSYFAGKR
jgi:hypothetical protein